MDDYEHAQKSVFDVGEELDTMVGTPMDGLTYLKCVRYEANRISHMNVSDIDPSAYFENRTFFVPPPKTSCIPSAKEFLPNKEWQERFIKEFLELRKTYQEYRKLLIEEKIEIEREHVPGLRDKNSWKSWCFGSKNRNPSMRLLLTFDEVLINFLVQHHIGWIQEDKPLCTEQAKWLYSLFIALDTLTDADMQANLRICLAKCCYDRAQITSIDDVMLPQLNILITIITNIFGQKEVID